MQPNQNQYSIDYLNQIAPAPQKSGAPGKWVVIFGILGFIAVVVIALSFMMKAGGGSSRDLETLSLRLTNTYAVNRDAQSKLKSNSLRNASSNLSIFLTNTNRDMAAQLKDSDIDTTKTDKTLLATETNTKILATLEDARLNEEYDSVYAREMSLRLAEINTLMNRIYDTTKSKSLKTFLEGTSASFEPIRKQYSLSLENLTAR